MSIFNKALGFESYDERPTGNIVTIDEKTVELKGPLSNAYTQALQEVYAKNDNATAEDGERVAQESNPTISVSQSNGETADTVVFAITPEDVTPEVITDVVSDVVAADRPDEYILVIDGTGATGAGNQTAEPTPEVVALTDALEHISLKFGAKVFHSFNEWVKSR